MLIESENNHYLNTAYTSLISGKHFNQKQRDIIKRACENGYQDAYLNRLASGDFNADQMEVLYVLFSTKQPIRTKYPHVLNMLLHDDFDSEQMEQAKLGIINVLDENCILYYLKKEYNAAQMYEIRDGIEKGLFKEDIDLYAKPYTPVVKMEASKNILLFRHDRLLVESYFDYDELIYKVIADSLLKNLSMDQINYGLNCLDITPEYKHGEDELHLSLNDVLTGFTNGLTIEDANTIYDRNFSHSKLYSLMSFYCEYYDSDYLEVLKTLSSGLYDLGMKTGSEEMLQQLYQSYQVFLEENTILNDPSIDESYLQKKTEDFIENVMDMLKDAIPEFTNMELLDSDLYKKKIGSVCSNKELFFKIKTTVLSSTILQKYFNVSQAEFDLYKVMDNIYRNKYNDLITNRDDILNILHPYKYLDEIGNDLIETYSADRRNKVFEHIKNGSRIEVQITSEDEYYIKSIQFKTSKGNYEIEGKAFMAYLFNHPNILPPQKTQGVQHNARQV